MIKLLLESDNVGGDISGLKTICYGGGPMYLSISKKPFRFLERVSISYTGKAKPL